MLAGNEVFYDHYQIDLNDEPDETEVEPKKKRKGELKTEYVGSHSPFGIVADSLHPLERELSNASDDAGRCSAIRQEEREDANAFQLRSIAIETKK